MSIKDRLLAIADALEIAGKQTRLLALEIGEETEAPQEVVNCDLESLTLGETIRKYVEDHGITYREFARQSGLTSGYISMLINERNPKTGRPPIPSVSTYMKIVKVVGLDRIRREKGITQAALASATNLSQPFIHDLEKGNRGAKRETLNKIAAALGCSVSDLVEEQEE